MKRLFITYLSITLIMNSSAIAQVKDLTGEYKMKRMEMVSVFVLKNDKTFEYYYMYGAVNRMAKGTYTQTDSSIILHGSKVPSKDFNVTGSKTDSAGTTIQVTDPTSALTENVLCLFEKGSQQDFKYTDRDGIAHSDFENCNNIFVMHLLYKDIMTTVVHGREENDHNNHYNLTLNPSLEDVCFVDLELKINGTSLIGSLPDVWEEEVSEFEKL